MKLKVELYGERAGLKEKLAESIDKNKGVLELVKSGEERYKDSLDWLNTEVCAGEEVLSRIEAKAKEIKENADAFVLIGVGGSNNAARSVIEGLKGSSGVEIIYAGNTLSPYKVNEMLKSLEGKDFYIDCIAKNFETLEPGSAFRILRSYMEKRYGKDANKRIIATGTPGSSLDELCREKGYDFFEFPVNVGGRYTAITNVGLLPMAVAGIDIRAIVKGASDMQKLLFSDVASVNQALKYACLRNIFFEEGYRVEMLSSFEPRFSFFNNWWVQLFAESEGKDDKGIFPVACEFSEELHSVGQFIQDGSPIMFETFLNVLNSGSSAVIEKDEAKDYFDYLDGKDFEEINRAAYNATIKAHSRKLPCIEITMEKIDEYSFGQLFYFFSFACYLSCKIMGVNPFNQPGVEAYKNWMFEALGKNK